MFWNIPRRAAIPWVTALGERRASQITPVCFKKHTTTVSWEAEKRSKSSQEHFGVSHHTSLDKTTALACIYPCAQWWQQADAAASGVGLSQADHLHSLTFFSPCTRGCKSYFITIIRSWTELRPSFSSRPKLYLSQLRERRENEVVFKSS